jgi:hypothetical protein
VFTDPRLPTLSCLCRIWARVREFHPEVPAVAILVVDRSTFGDDIYAELIRFADATPRCVPGRAVAFVAKYLFRPAEEVLETLLHEAAHTLVREHFNAAFEEDPHGPSFIAAAQMLGLVSCVTLGRVSHTALRPTTKERYASQLRELEGVLAELACVRAKYSIDRLAPIGAYDAVNFQPDET